MAAIRFTVHDGHVNVYYKIRFSKDLVKDNTDMNWYNERWRIRKEVDEDFRDILEAIEDRVYPPQVEDTTIEES